MTTAARLLRSPTVFRHSAPLHRSWTRTHPNPDYFLSSLFPLAPPSHRRNMIGRISGAMIGSITGSLILIGLDRSNGENSVLSKSEAELDSEGISNEEKKWVKDVPSTKEESVFPNEEYIDPLEEAVDLQKEKDRLLGEEALHALAKLLGIIYRETENKRECSDKEKEVSWEDICNRVKNLEEEMKRMGEERGSKGKEGVRYFARILKVLENIFGLPMRLMKLKMAIEEGTVLMIAVYMSLPTVLVLNKTEVVDTIKDKWQELYDKASSLGGSHLITSSDPSSVDAVPLPPTPPSADMGDAGDDKDEEDKE